MDFKEKLGKDCIIYTPKNNGNDLRVSDECTIITS